MPNPGGKDTGGQDTGGPFTSVLLGFARELRAAGLSQRSRIAELPRGASHGRRDGELHETLRQSKCLVG